MEFLKEYEVNVVKLLTSSSIPSEKIDSILQSSKFIGYEYTGSGYFLSMRHSAFPKERIVCSRPILLGKTSDGIICGFVIFIENNQLTLECHSWGEINVPEDFRERGVQITIEDIKVKQNN